VCEQSTDNVKFFLEKKKIKKLRLSKHTYTEEEMVRGCIANDRAMQEQLYRRFMPPMMQMCMRYASESEEALTIVNDGFLRVFKKIHLYGFKGSLEGWIRKVVWHSLSDYYRKKSKSLKMMLLEERDAPAIASGTSQLYAEDILKLVEQLPPATKEVFRLYAIEGYTHAEIGKQLGISDGTSKWHLSTARQQLKALLNETNEDLNQFETKKIL
jgi:RNA polymerase sigma-70 factor (ECF subfamily)